MKDWGEPMGYEEVISKLEQRIEDSREELRNIGYHHTVDYDCEDLQIAIDAVERLMPTLPLISHCECGMSLDDWWGFCPNCGQALVVRGEPD